MIETDSLEAIVSTAPLINYSIARILQEKGLTKKIAFYIVVTDPYDPIAPGFDVKGADGYFCFSESVRNILVKAGINEELIHLTSFPVAKRFLKTVTESEKIEIYEKLNLDPCKRTILINSGTYGNNGFFQYLKQIHKFDRSIQVIFICGKNIMLKVNVSNYKRLSECSNVLALEFVDNLEQILEIADVCISKAGASTFYETLAKGTFLIIDAVNGFLYQERGVKDIIDESRIGAIAYSYEDILLLLEKFYSQDTITDSRSIFNGNGAVEIVHAILNLM